MIINHKQVDMNSLMVAGVDTNDHPDYVDAYIEQAWFIGGTELTEQELSMIDDDVAQELAFESLLD